MKTVAALTLALILAVPLRAAEFEAPANSPIARGEHPRLFITGNTVDELRGRIRAYYKSDFQKLIDELDNLYNDVPSSGGLNEWNHRVGAARAFSLAYVVDPATIEGISAQHTRNEYGRKAIRLGVYLAHGIPSSWHEPHSGGSSMTSDDGGLMSLGMQIVYDWTHDLTSLSERQEIADGLIRLWGQRYDTDKPKLENHWAANTHIYAGALCFYGDSDLGSSYSEKGQQMMNSFQDVFIERQLGTAERLYEGSSDWVEGDTYSMDSYLALMLLGGAASSALGENLFATSSWLHYAPYYLYFNTMPMPYHGKYYLSQQNQSRGISLATSTTCLMNIAAAMLMESDPDISSFAAWFCNNEAYGRDVDDYRYYKPHLYDFFYKFVFGTRHVTPKSPDEAGIPLSVHLGQMHVMRSDHSINDATLVQFFSPMYWYPNGHNEEEHGAFNVHRFGTLAVAAAIGKNAGDGIPRASGNGMSQNNVFGLGSGKELSLDMGSIRSDNDTPSHYVPGAKAHIGTVEAREYKENLYDYVNYNYTRSYKGGDKASLARRALTYLRGSVNNEYVVIMDRVKSSREKFFVIHTPADIEAVSGSWQKESSGHWTSSPMPVSVTNRIDQAHGRMFLTSVFPSNATFHKFGGSGYEWVWADGSPLSYSSSDFGERAAYLASNHTFQIRSQENQFLTVIQIGDANTMNSRAPVEKLSGDNWIGALLNKERLVIFSKSEVTLHEFSYRISSNKSVKHLVTELTIDRQYAVNRDGAVVATGSTGPNGTISFSDNPGGSATYSVSLSGPAPTAVDEPEEAMLPEDIILVNYPNPFNPATTIRFRVSVEGDAELNIYNIDGQRVRSLVSETIAPGEHSVVWDGTADDGSLVASGVYFYSLNLNGFIAQRKFVLAK